ncbi:MAG: hypothetical protein CML23_26025 [Rhizobiaceae bacterium]|nr:hypothetical protein [Rhizobiaceae bacterium]
MSALQSSMTAVALITENAGPAQSWVHLVPAGEFSGIDGRGPYRLDDPEGVINGTRQLFGQRQIVIDYEHQAENSQKNGKPAPAAGWIVGLQARENGIWGLVEWTDTAAAHIAKREYRYISPVFYHTKTGVVTRRRNAALTNSPNLDQLIALNRAGADMDNDELAEKLAQAAQLLGLPETAGKEEITARFNSISALAKELAELTGEQMVSEQAAVPDPSKFVPIGDYKRAISEVNKLRSGVTKEKAEAHVAQDIRNGKIPPFMSEWAVSLCTTNLSAYDEFVSGVGGSFTELLKPSRVNAKPPVSLSFNSALSSEEKAVCRNMGLTPEQYLSAQGRADRNME